MSALKNRHVLVAGLVAPVLALMAYFGIDYLFGEKPHAAVAGQSYALVEKPDCRYGSGPCGLKNGDFELELRMEPAAAGRALLMLRSVVPLDGVKVGLAENGATSAEPAAMFAGDDEGLLWSLELRRPDPQQDRLQLVAASRDALWFGDVATAFTQPESGAN